MHRNQWLASIALLLAVGPISGAQTAPSVEQQIQEHSRKAHTYLQQKRPDLAIPEYEAVIAIDPKNIDAQANLGVLLFFQGKYDRAATFLRNALAIQPEQAKLRMLLGISEQRIGDANAARADLEQSMTLLKEPNLLVQAGMELIDLYTQTGDLEKTVAVIAQLRQADPTNPRILYSAYRIYSDLMSESLLSLSLVAPESAQMHYAMAHELARQGNTEAAIEQIRKALKIDPALPGAHVEIAELLETMPDAASKAAAQQEYEAALKANPNDEKAECRLGDISNRKGDVKASYAHYSRALQLQPSDEDAMLGLAKTLISMDQQAKALPLLEQAVQAEPTDATAHFRLSNLYRQQGRTEDARREVEQYKKYKDMKEKLRAIYKEMQVQPGQKQADEQEER
jgi:tetratricopeptide (TPR) repeat protein